MGGKMIGRLRDLTFGANGEQHVTVTVKSDFRERFDELKDTDIDVEIKKHRKKRSLDANAYAWVLIDRLAAVLSLDKAAVYKEAIKSIGGVSEVVCVKERAAEKLISAWETHGIGWQTETFKSKLDGCVNVTLYYGSSTYDTKQMSLLIDRLVSEAKELSIETLSPDELRRLVGANESEDATKKQGR
jgi:hypothetical protein